MRLACTLSMLAVVALALGAEAATRQGAAHQRNGQRLFKQGKFAEALTELQAARLSDPGWEYLFDIGLCEARLGHHAEAMEAFDTYLREGGGQVGKKVVEAVNRERDAIRSVTAEVIIAVEGGPAEVWVGMDKLGQSPIEAHLWLPKGQKVFRATREGYKEAEKTVDLVPGAPTTVLLILKELGKDPAQLSVETEPEGAEVFIDGKSVGTAPLEHPLAAGGHVVVAELEGHATAEQEVHLAPGQHEAVSLTLEKVVVEVKRPFPLTGVIVGGAGAVGVVTALALMADAQSKKEQVSALFKNGGTWDEQYAATDSGRKTEQALSVVLGLAGGAALATGLVLISLQLFALPAQPAKVSPQPGEAPAEGQQDPDGEAPAAEPEKEKAADDASPESSFLFAPLPGGAYAGWRVRF